MYTKWIDLVEINKPLKKNLQEVQDQKESLEKRNYKLMAQVKNVTKRLKGAESRIACMNTGKVKLDEILEASRPTGLKTGYVGGKKITDDVKNLGNLESVFRRENMSNIEKRQHVKCSTNTRQRDLLLCVVIV